MKLSRLEKTCEACPTQWVGFTPDGIPVYFRYRWGYASVYVGDKPSENISDAVNGIQVYGRTHGDGLHGIMEDAVVLGILESLPQP